MDFDSFFTDRAESATPAQANDEELALDEFPLPVEPSVEPSVEPGLEPHNIERHGLEQPGLEQHSKPVIESPTPPAEVAKNRSVEPDPEFNIYGDADDDWAVTDEVSSVAEMPVDTPVASAEKTPIDNDAPASASLQRTDVRSEQATDVKQADHATVEPISALDDLALELPDDWASLKKAPRQEPVFDDDNGLDPDERAATTSKPAAKPPLGKSGKDRAAVPAPVVASKPPATEPLDLGKPAVTSAAPAKTPAAEKTPAPEKPAEPEKTAPKKFGVFEADSDESFELHPDLAAFNNDEPVIGDWSLNQNETVDTAGEGDQLRPPAPTVSAPRQLPPDVASPATATAAASLKSASPKSATKTEPDTAAIADFGDISSDWDKPSIQLQASDSAKITAEPQPEPFDSEAFTADPGSRVFQPVIDPLDDLSSDDWTLVSTEPRDDYEASLFAPPPKRRFPWKGLAWTAAAVLTLVLLVSQLLWPQRGELREDPQWGPWVESICQHMDCDLPPRVDVSKVQLQQKSVLKDRTDPRVLQIDLLIANKAEFSQPYPDIKLRFTNIEAEVVAERRFKPSEYLREQPDSDQMPVGVPIHIAFTVRAPDAKVTGYEFDFLPTGR